MTSTEPDDITCGEQDEAPGRIRWEPTPYGGRQGDAGSQSRLFYISPSHSQAGAWRLMSMLPGGRYGPVWDADPDVLKATAETWLAEFVASLGAVFPEEG